MSTCLVVMSGGQDSTTCLFLALRKYTRVQAVCFNYGQRHSLELTSARSICSLAGVPLQEVDISFLSSVGQSSLTRNGDSVFVRNRNAIFLTIAHGIAQNIGADVVMTGVCQGDFQGFSDCREDFIKSIESTLNLGYNSNIAIETPLMHKTKADTFELGEALGILHIILNDTLTCYNGVAVRHDWGMGCGDCNACLARRGGWECFIQQKHTATKWG